MLIQMLVILVAITSGALLAFDCSQTTNCSSCNSGNYSITTGETTSQQYCQQFSCYGGINCDIKGPICTAESNPPQKSPALNTNVVASRVRPPFGNSFFAPQAAAPVSQPPKAARSLQVDISPTEGVPSLLESASVGVSADGTQIVGLNLVYRNSASKPLTATRTILTVHNERGETQSLSISGDMFLGFSEIAAGARHDYNDPGLLVTSKTGRIVSATATVDFAEFLDGTRVGPQAQLYGVGLDHKRQEELETYRLILNAYGNPTVSSAATLNAAMNQVWDSRKVGCSAVIEEIKRWIQAKGVDYALSRLRSGRQFVQ